MQGIPLYTPTPIPPSANPIPMDISQLDPQIMGARIAIDTVGLWNNGIDDAWGYISALLVVSIIILAVISIMYHLQNLE